MNSRFWRVQLRNFIFGLALEYAICLTISFAFNDSNQFGLAFVILLAMWAVQIVVWFKRLIVSTATYYLFAKRELSGEVVAALKHNRFPIYDAYAPDAGDYLNRVATDTQATREQIIYAASLAGQIDLMKQIGPIGAWRMLSCAEAAIDQYRRH